MIEHNNLLELRGCAAYDVEVWRWLYSIVLRAAYVMATVVTALEPVLAVSSSNAEGRRNREVSKQAETFLEVWGARFVNTKILLSYREIE